MATSKEFMEHIEAQLAGCGAVSRKMFGEYTVYLDGKVIALVCDDRFLVKVTPSSQEMLPDARREPPYAGARPMLVADDLGDADFLCTLAARVAAELPEPKPKKKKQRSRRRRGVATGAII